MKKTYNYIEVLLSLREEYLKNELELEKLKELTELKDDKITDYYFICVESYTNKLLLDREVIKSKFKQLIERFRDVIDLSSISECRKDEFGNYVIEEWSYKTPTILNQKAFNEQADKILTSEFVKNITNRSILVSNGNINFTSSSILLHRDNYKKRCGYWAHDDCLQIQSVSKLNDADLFYLLDTSIPTTSLNDWQREIIDRNYDQIGDIIYPEIIKPCRKINLSIDKEDHKVYLKRM